jgi:hypothetical protein
MRRVLEGLKPIRDHIGRIRITGSGWDSPLALGSLETTEDANFTEPGYLRKLGVEVRPPVRFDRVIDSMSEGLFSPVILRPLFDHLRLVTCRTFETPAANTIPLFVQDRAYVEEIYGERAVELVLPNDEPQEKILDIVQQPGYYGQIVNDIRQRLAEEHSYAVRFRELLQIIDS